MSGRSLSVGRVLGELAIVFLGVLLALAADSYRERRGERLEAREALSVVAADLEADSVELAAVRERLARHAAAAAWLIRNWENPDASIDSAATALATIADRNALQLNSAAFRGLQNTNRLRLVESDSLRNSILVYFQTWHPGLLEFSEIQNELRERILFERIAPYVRHLGGAGEGLWPPVEPSLELRTRWEVLVEDDLLHSEIVWFGRYSDFLSGQMAQTETRASALRRQIEDYLGRK